ncbi:MAG: oxygen-independent coproporphyrinogen III oxidase [Chloracidobacterium sp.]|uniref:Coproporphyrinogen-III oxidase n=1 Tax=Chloracidobacterium validum TaxID=2821543 RepID=A0ABX8BF63_9BACT|nr:oxygen-independent coproporphyrinogen III oxidase [Chloracidobacterium validum]QUW04555.1 oxygen-independent coproporphyrinogen III oxidase [Chloracidobacterium validum]
MTTKIESLLQKYSRPGPRYTSYPTVPVWSDRFGATDYQTALRELSETPDAQDLCLYVHLPFCAMACHYCGCNNAVTSKTEVVDAYLDRVAREINLVVDLLGRGRRVVQMHWGGGTPNTLTARQMERLVQLLGDAFDLDWRGEMSIEIDPRIASLAQLQHIRSLGFRRISLGVQDVDPQVQQAIGRHQPEALTKSIYAACRDVGFESINLDLVYGLPLQTSETFRQTVQAVLAMQPDRVALFNYAHVPKLRPKQRHIRTEDLPDVLTRFALFDEARQRLTSHDYVWVGMDHFARQGDELAVAVQERRLHRNFMGYTLRPASNLIAFGMSGISELTGFYAQNDAKLGRYQTTLDQGELPIARGHRLTPDDQRRRAAISHLMCNMELPLATLGEAFDAHAAHFQDMEADGLVDYTADRLVVTAVGRPFVRNICMTLDAYLKPGTSQPVFSKTL